ncbi:MAG TPA: hypothetical protein VNJ01_15790 [Bacteriovoracaceae bacterium]|nr:hypothetical protein [Bacteriovoracaceae bacterium]
MIKYDPKEIYKTRNDYLLAVFKRTAGLNLFVSLFLGLTILFPILVFVIEGEFKKDPLSLIFFGYFILFATSSIVLISRWIQGM